MTESQARQVARAKRVTDEVLAKLLTNASSTASGPPSPSGEGYSHFLHLFSYRLTFIEQRDYRVVFVIEQ